MLDKDPSNSRFYDYFAATILMVSAALMLLNRDPFSLATTFPDERNAYIPTAQLVLQEGLSYFLNNLRSLSIAPLNTLWIAVWNVNLPYIITANVWLVASGGLVMWSLAKRLCSPRVALVIVLFYAFYPEFYTYAPTVLTEPLFIFLELISLWLLVIASEKNSRGIAFLAGIVLAITTLTRPTAQLFPLFLLCLLLLMIIAERLYRSVGPIFAGSKPNSENRTFWTEQIMTALVFLLGFLIVFAPYVVKNKICFDKLGVANGSGTALYLGTDLRRHGAEPAYSHFRYDTSEHTAPFTHLEIEGDAILSALAKERIAENPADIVLLSFRKMARFVFGSPHGFFFPYTSIKTFARRNSSFGTFVAVLHLLLFVGASVFGIIGFIALFKRSHIAWILGSFVLYLVGVHSATFVIHRYALPIYPCMLLLAGGLFSSRSRFGIKTCLVGTLLALLIAWWIAYGAIFLGPDVSERYRGYFETELTINPSNVIEHNDVKDLKNGQWQSTGRNPFVILKFKPFQAKKNQVFFLQMNVHAARKLRRKRIHLLAFWSDSSKFSERQSALFEIVPDGMERIYMISPALSPHWTGTISHLRLDFTKRAKDFRYHISTLDLRR